MWNDDWYWYITKPGSGFRCIKQQLGGGQVQDISNSRKRSDGKPELLESRLKPNFGVFPEPPIPLKDEAMVMTFVPLLTYLCISVYFTIRA